MSPPFEAPGRWIADRRGEGRGVRVSAHEEAGFLVLSTWKANVCVGTVRLLPDEAADLVAGLAEALGRLASRPLADQHSADLEIRLAALDVLTKEVVDGARRACLITKKTSG